MGDSELNDWLSTTLIFQGLSASQLTALTDIAQLRTFGKGDLVFEQGCKATGFFVIKIGRVKVFQLAANGREQILNIFEARDNFAEVAAMDGQCFPASATALEPATLLFVPRTEFLALLHQYPDIAINMLVTLARHSRHLVKVVENLSFKDVPQRLAAYLLSLNDGSVNESQVQRTVTLNMSKSQLAAALGTIPATLSRAFYRLSTDGIIAMQGMQVEILDCDRLQDLSLLQEHPN
ncbi:CRP-like cAMP-activated global transcriptional regulator [Acaryochloris thomasi RCC1774]|uniref:CRP-like cAMP-activated global transcriptional regulator n=1 Tax=Acaryochloris thomasi RCC1774 TaxID=1764569 RepID=A0A2W1JJB1_9CYAN|nr:Crp/Fnr family transcriptional regulator [Acaryochloris thomasi]PZD73563.1 CRP-like cAMP-activated global transcriptional regulator [Acaryochloris thomasi RCC1774]